MRMQEIGSQAVYDTLQTISAVTALVGSRIVNMPFWPMDVEFPACLHFSEPGGDGYSQSAIDSQGIPHELSLRYVIRFGTRGESSDLIDAAADAVFQRFSIGAPLVSPSGYAVQSKPLDPVSQMFSLGVLVEGGEIYRQVGDYYALNVLRYG